MFNILKREVINSFLAGMLVAIGGAVFLSCPSKVFGAILFSAALLCICFENFSLYTGKVCYFPEKTSKGYFLELLCCLLGNIYASSFCAFLLKWTHADLSAASDAICNLKLSKTLFQNFIDAFFCGILIYLAVNIYRKNKSFMGILLCVPVFVLCGFEHCIADVFYFFLLNDINTVKYTMFILTVIVGNSLGGMLIPFLKKLQVSTSF